MMATATATRRRHPPAAKSPLERKATVTVTSPDTDHASALPPLPPLSTRPEYHEFSKIVLQAMLKKRMSQSDLAREMWGITKDSRGYEVAKNRDRITHYLKGRAYPEPKNLEALAKALDLPIEALQVDKPAKGITSRNTSQMDVQLHFLSTEPNRCLLVIQKVISTKLALEIANKINEEDQAEKPVTT